MAKEEIHLENGIILKIEDKIKPLSGDLHMLKMTFSIVLPLDEGDVEMRPCIGDTIVRSRTFEKSGVAKTDIEKVKRTFRESFISTTMPYISSDKFVKRLKQRTLEEMKERQAKEKMRHA